MWDLYAQNDFAAEDRRRSIFPVVPSGDEAHGTMANQARGL
jgi:hypothetical protein